MQNGNPGLVVLGHAASQARRGLAGPGPWHARCALTAVGDGLPKDSAPSSRASVAGTDAVTHQCDEVVGRRHGAQAGSG
eukprot:9800850-Heterocapsa_arctica.AAC.1